MVRGAHRRVEPALRAGARQHPKRTASGGRVHPVERFAQRVGHVTADRALAPRAGHAHQRRQDRRRVADRAGRLAVRAGQARDLPARRRCGSPRRTRATRPRAAIHAMTGLQDTCARRRRRRPPCRPCGTPTRPRRTACAATAPSRRGPHRTGRRPSCPAGSAHARRTRRNGTAATAPTADTPPRWAAGP